MHTLTDRWQQVNNSPIHTDHFAKNKTKKKVNRTVRKSDYTPALALSKHIASDWTERREKYSCLSLSRPRLSRPYHLCRTDVRVPYIYPIYLLYFNFACLELLLSRHIGYLAHQFQSEDIFFTYFTTAYLEPASMTECRKTEKRNDAAGLLIKDYY